MKHNTRIAPSPTGHMHIGTLRTAYFNWLVARSTGGKFYVRIDDTDQKRSEKKYEDEILAILDWVGLDYDGVVYQSSLNRDKYINILKENNAVVSHSNGALALDNSFPIEPMWEDTLIGVVSPTKQDYEELQNLILIRGDGSPTYHFASTVDDIILDITWVIRGTDHIRNTMKQTAIRDKIIGYKLGSLKHTHVGLIFKDKKKLSKRDGAASVLYYKDNGYNPDALLNFLLRMGWGPTVDDKTTKVLNKERALELFVSGGRMRAAHSNFDQAKLDSFDRKYKAIEKQQTNK